MNINTYLRLLKTELGYLGIKNKESKIIVEALMKDFQARTQKGMGEEDIIHDLGHPKEYAKKFKKNTKGIARGYWTVMGLSLAIVFGVTFNDITLAIIFLGAFFLIDLTTKS